jgi:putative PIN family toxin of toxin-antitoxin system
MKLVLDTNIYISAYYWGGNSQKIIGRIIDGVDELYISKKILKKISEVMARPKFKSEQKTRDEYIETIEKKRKN